MNRFRIVALIPAALCIGLVCIPLSADSGPALQVNAGSARHPIDPHIYGINFDDEVLAKELRLPVSRWGGNSTTRYNWKNNVSNRASDWFFENLPEGNYSQSGLPDGSAVNSFIEQNGRTGTDTILTIPLIGWTPDVSKCAPGIQKCNCGFSILKYGLQHSSDWQWWPDCGDGVKSDGTTKITGNDPTDASLAIGPEFVQEWMRYLIGRYGPASRGGIRFYNLDNEPMLWNSTHRDVHPDPTSYDEMRERTQTYAFAIKQVDPDAKTLGPVLWGWNAYFYSALDTARDGWWNYPPPDRNAHGGTPFVDWYLQQMRDYEKNTGTRILDYLDLHFYPQANGVSGSDASTDAIRALRLRSTRGLWDLNYRDESWINNNVRLIPRMRDWVANNYPGTKISITEYNWGALRDMNGALAQAEVLGIFGREGVDLATLWGPDGSNYPWAFAFRMYRNYDASGGSFGDIAMAATSGDPDKLSIFAAQRTSDSAITIIAINKSSTDLTSAVALDGFSPAGSAKVFRYSAADLTHIQTQPDQAFTAGGFSATFPKNSITMLVVPAVVDSRVFAHLAAGGGYSTIFTLLNTGGSVATGNLSLTTQDGKPLVATLSPSDGSTLGSSLGISMAPGATSVVTVTRPGAADVQSGWAVLSTAGGSIGGVATFQLSSGPTLKTLAGVLAAQTVEAAVIPIDNDDPLGKYTGFAIANPGSADIHLSVTLRGMDGTPVTAPSIGTISLGTHNQIAKFLHNYDKTLVNFRGTMTIAAQTGERFAVVALTQNQGLFTAIPVLILK